MKVLFSPRPFGKMYIPALTPSQLTASYSATQWDILSSSWRITMYWTVPGSDNAVEMPSVTLRDTNVEAHAPTGKR